MKNLSVSKQIVKTFVTLFEKVLQKDVIMGLSNHSVLISKSGKEYLIDDSAAPIRDEEGNITGVVLVFHDIAERKLAEQARKRAKELLEVQRNLMQTLIDTMRREPILSLDALKKRFNKCLN